MRPVNISSDDIVDGDSQSTLALVWTIIRHWQVSSTSTYTLNNEAALLSVELSVQLIGITH